MGTLIDFFLNIDESLREAALTYPTATYGILFAVLYTETAFFPLAPFFPGDGLLFAIGVLAAGDLLSMAYVMPLLSVAAALGAWTGYGLGKWLGLGLFDRFSWLNHGHYRKSHQFYERHGGAALFISRYLPIVKALVPFVAGVARMDARRFSLYNVLSATLWVASLVLLGYLSGNVPFVRDHPSWLVIGLAAIFVGGLLVTAVVKGVKKLLR